MSRSHKARILLLLVTLIWGTTFVLVKSALSAVSPLVFNSVRMLIATAALVVIFHRKLRTISRGAIAGGMLLGVFLWLGYAFQTSGLRLTTPSKSAFLTGLSVVLVPLLVAVAARRLPSRWTIFGVLAAFAGLYLMTMPAGGGFALASMNRGDLLTMGCAASFALHIFFNGRMTRRHAFEHIAVVQVATAAVLMPLSIVLESPRLVWSGQVVFALVFTGVVCTAVAFSVQAWAQQYTPATHTALIFSTEPVFAAVTSYLFLGEHLGTRGTMGAVLILGGILIAELKGSAVEPAAGFEANR